MLEGGSLVSHHSQNVGRHSSAMSHHKRSCCGCFGCPGAQGSAISAFNPLAAQWCVLHRQGFSSSVCQTVAGETLASTPKIYQQCWKEWGGWCAWEGLPINDVSAPKLANFLLHLFQVGQPGNNWYIMLCYFCFFGSSLASQGFNSSCHLKINASFLFTASSFS